MAVYTDEVIRHHLRDHPSQTVMQIALALNLGPSRVRAVLKSMVDAYVSEYVTNIDESSGRVIPSVAVYCVADIPGDCPLPTTERAA